MSSDTLRTYIVWLPALFSDSRNDALEASAECADSRVKYYWDDDKLTGKAYQQTLQLNRSAWDIYFLYNRGVKWSEETPPVPGFWMHQLWGLEDMAPLLDSATLAQRIEAALQGQVVEEQAP